MSGRSLQESIRDGSQVRKHDSLACHVVLL